jgi:hypothetical protein
MFKSRRRRTLNVLGLMASTLAVSWGLAIAPALPAGAVTETATLGATSRTPQTGVPPYAAPEGKPARVLRKAANDVPAASGTQNVIDFADLADGTVVTNQYPGVTFSSAAGNVNYVSDQSEYNTPSFICTGPAGGSIDCTADTIVDFTSPVSGLTLDAVGIQDTGQVAEVEVYGAGGLLGTVSIIGDAGGYTAQLVDLSAYSDVTSIDITGITDPAGIGWTNFSFTTGPSFTAKGTEGTVGQADKQDTGSAGDAKICETRLGQIRYKAAEDVGNSLVAEWDKHGYTTAADFLADFLGGSGNAVTLPDTSLAATEIKKSPEFTTENKDIIAYIGQQLARGATQIQLPEPRPVKALGFNSLFSEPDLYFALRNTSGIDVNGSGNLVGTDYVGSLTYVISESYGFSTGNILLGFGTAMRYLQTTCGAPYYKGGAQWFPVSVTVTMPFNIPK